MTIEKFLEQSAHITHTYKITPEVFDGFQRCSNDFNALHTDAEFANTKGFDQPVMYGNILNAFLSHFVGMLLPTRDVMILSQTILYQNPFFMNDDLSFESSIDKYSPTVNVVDYKFKFRREKEGKKVLIANGHIQIKLLA